MSQSQDHLSIRQIEETDFENVVDYFLKADKNFLLGMGVDSSKLPGKEKWLDIMVQDYQQPFEKKKFCHVIWLRNNVPIGHSNINKIIFLTLSIPIVLKQTSMATAKQILLLRLNKPQ